MTCDAGVASCEFYPSILAQTMDGINRTHVCELGYEQQIQPYHHCHCQFQVVTLPVTKPRSNCATKVMPKGLPNPLIQGTKCRLYLPEFFPQTGDAQNPGNSPRLSD